MEQFAEGCQAVVALVGKALRRGCNRTDGRAVTIAKVSGGRKSSVWCCGSWPLPAPRSKAVTAGAMRLKRQLEQKAMEQGRGMV